MTFTDAIVLGIVEGVTEFLPISSTAHLVLVARLLALPQTEFLKLFEVVIQAAAIVAVLLVFGQRLLRKPHLLQPVLIAFLPSGMVGFLVYKLLKQSILGNIPLTALALLVGGILLLIFESVWKNKQQQTIETLTPLHSIVIGLGQAVAFVPGVSRAAATSVTGMMLGLSRGEAVEFSFLLAIPTILAASVYDLIKSRAISTTDELVLIAIGCIAAFLAAYITTRWFIRYISAHTFIPFALYRIVLAIVMLLFLH